MQKQFELLNHICKCIFSTNVNFDTMEFVYSFSPEEEWSGTRTSAVKNNEKISLNLSSNIMNEIENTCELLHAEMQAHTGGDWRKFILTIDENREAKTKFIYEPQSCMDDVEELF